MKSSDVNKIPGAIAENIWTREIWIAKTSEENNKWQQLW